MKEIINKILLAFLAVILFPILAGLVLLYLLGRLSISVAIWIVWGGKGRDILFISSDSPVWSEYIEQEILSRIRDKAVILNWSERRQWRNSLAVLAFKFFGGGRNFNPMAIVFHPFRAPKEFRFYEAFKDFKHGRTAALEKLKTDFFRSIEG